MKSVEKRKKIALVTAWYPPTTGIAVGRMNAFANYLSEYFEVEVFCLGKKEISVQKSQNIQVHYFTSNRIFENLKSNPSDRKLKHNLKTISRIALKYVVKNPLNSWKKSIVSKLKLRQQQEPFDLIISSYSPAEAHEAVLEFKQLYPSIPWIADMRDEMSSNPYLNGVVKKGLIDLENRINECATAILSVSKPILDQFRVICPNVHYFEEIRNGFDHTLQFEKREKEDTIFRLGYFGSFYGARKPDLLFAALEELKRERPDFNFKICIYGAHNNFSIPITIKENIERYEGLPYNEAILKMNEMDANILIHPKSEQKGVFSGKIFDYISAEKPILAFVDPEDVAAKLIEEMVCGYVADFTDLKQNKQIVLQFFEDSKKGISKIASETNITSLHRRKQIDKLADLIAVLTKK